MEKYVVSARKYRPTNFKDVVGQNHVTTTLKNAINNNWQGTVIVDVTVDDKGKVVKVNIYRSSGFDILDQSFVDTVKSEYYFKPKRVLGEDKTDTIRLKYDYEW